MSFDAYENSVELGQPVRLYKFTLGAKNWYYTSADVDLTIDGTIWKAVPISDNGFKSSGDTTGGQIVINTVSSIGAISFFNGYAPGSRISMAVFEKHYADDEVYASYFGEVIQVAYTEPGQVSITCDTLGSTLEAEGLRLSWQKGCPYSLYDSLTCRLNPTTLAVSGYVTAVNGFTLTVEGLEAAAVGRFGGGYIEWVHPSKGAESRSVSASNETTLTMFGSTDDIYPGMSFTAYPGCARTKDACISLGNYINYGGMPYLPSNSPFDGDPVF